MTVQATLLGYEYFRDRNYQNPRLYLLFYDNGKHEILKIPAKNMHKPYLLTLDRKLPKTSKIKGTEKTKRFHSIKNVHVNFTKVLVDDPNDIAKIRRRFKSSWEDHIFYHLNYVYDNQLVYGCTHQISMLEPYPLVRFNGNLEEYYNELFSMAFINYKRCAIDIEVKVKEGEYVNVEKADKPIIAIAVATTDGKHKIFALANQKETIGNIHFYTDEKQMLKDFYEYIRDYPIKITHGGDNFDLPYLRNRSRNLGLKHIPITPKREFYSFADSIHIDLSEFFSNNSIQTYVFGKKYQNATLEEISWTLLREHKLPRPNFEKASPLEIAIYCWNDAYLTLKLTTFNNNLVMNLITMLSRIANMDMETATRKTVSSWIRSLYHYVHRLYGYVIPNEKDLKRFNPLDKKGYKGAMILDPTELGTMGVHFDVWELDFSSLYPSCVETRNISYDTVNCPHPECRHNKVPETNIHICTKKKGILPIMFGALKNLRVKKYKPFLKQVEQNLRENKDENLAVLKSYLEAIVGMLKVIINAGYGVFGDSDLSDLYCQPVAEATTAYGRLSLKIALEEAEKMGGKVLAGHTDSLYVKGLTKEQVYELSKRISERLKIDFEVQKHYRMVAFWKKANYLTVDDYGNVRVVGLLGKKRHIPAFIKEQFEKLKKLIAPVKTYNELDKLKEEIRNLCRQTRNMLYNGEIKLNQLAFLVTLHKDIDKGKGQDYMVARLYKQKVNPNLSRGDRIRKILTNPKLTGVSALPLELVQNLNVINREKYLEHIKSVFGQVLQPLGIEPEEAFQTYKTVQLV